MRRYACYYWYALHTLRRYMSLLRYYSLFMPLIFIVECHIRHAIIITTPLILPLFIFFRHAAPAAFRYILIRCHWWYADILLLTLFSLFQTHTPYIITLLYATLLNTLITPFTSLRAPILHYYDIMTLAIIYGHITTIIDYILRHYDDVTLLRYYYIRLSHY